MSIVAETLVAILDTSERVSLVVASGFAERNGHGRRSVAISWQSSGRSTVGITSLESVLSESSRDGWGLCRVVKTDLGSTTTE